MNTAKGTTPKALQEGTNNVVGESFRVLYYGSAAAGSVPFIWESQPGTPKHTFTESSLPPLTPPPSYHQHSQKYNPSMQFINHRSSKRSGFLGNIFLASSRKKNIGTEPSMSFSSSSISSSDLHSWQSTPMSKMMPGGGSPASTRCLGGGFKRGYRINKMKTAIQWFVR